MCGSAANVWECSSGVHRQPDYTQPAYMQPARLHVGYMQPAYTASLTRTLQQNQGCCVSTAAPVFTCAPLHACIRTFDSAGLRVFAQSLNGREPLRSWYAMTPAAHTSQLGPTCELSISGAMNLRMHVWPQNE
eukprot:360908-Chlamydomonas_euryale.AAC.24